MAHFELAMVALMLAAAGVTKTGAARLAVRWLNMPVDRQAWALEHGQIDQTVFVAVIAMA